MKRTKKQSQLDQSRFKALYDLSKMLDRSEQEILDFALEAGVKVTNSEIGYIYFVNSDETKLYLHAWSKNVMPQCSIESYPDAYIVSETGLWGEAVRQRKAVITNNYKTSPYKKGYPKGHVPVQNHMNLPVFDDGKIVIIAGVGNKAENYTQEDTQQLSLIMDGMWNIVKRKRVEQELKTTNENLEKIIDERTIELQTANEELHYIIEKQGRTESVLAQSEAVFRGVFDNASAAILLLSPEGDVTLANRICAQLLGYTQKELLSKNMSDLVHPDDLANALESMEKHLQNDDITWHNERRLITKNKESIWGNLNLTVLRNTRNDIESFIIVATDITARIVAEQALIKSNLDLEKSREQLQIIMDNVPAIISYVDKNLCYQFVNKYYEVIFKIDPNKLIGQSVISVIGQDTFDKVEPRYKAALKGETQRFEMKFSNLNQNYTLNVNYIPHIFEGNIEGLFILVLDITEQKEMEKHLELLSITDPLTGAKNRRFFMDNGLKEMNRCTRYATTLSMMMIDIDHFKNINDTYGHIAGDEVLKQLVKASGSVLRNTDMFSRIGGEEFAAILIETDLKKAKIIAERLRKVLENLCIKIDKHKIRFTVSLGLTQRHSDSDSLDQLMKRADTALYKAKRKGRNKVVTVS